MGVINYLCRYPRFVRNCGALRTSKAFCSSTNAFPAPQNESNESQATQPSVKEDSTKPFDYQLAEHRFVFPEFLPTPHFELRNKVREKLERTDMLKRRSVINIPEFYTGSILAVTCSDPYSPGKENRFVGICIYRSFWGLRATFSLRNAVDNQGVEITYDLYNPTIHKIEVLRLEKRLDEELLYLRDCPIEYSTFPFNMEPEYRVEGEPVKVNPLKVKLKPLPWTQKWERFYFKGVEPFDDMVPGWRAKNLIKSATPWEAYDIMKQYRRTIPEDDQQEIWEEVAAHQKQFQLKKQKWKQRTLQKATRKITDRH